MRRAFVVGGAAVMCAGAWVACGGGTTSSPSQPPAVSIPAPATPPPSAPRPLSVIPPCAIPPNPVNENCVKKQPVFGDQVQAAIDRALVERPELFDFKDIDGGPRILDYPAYMVAVVAALGEAGLCGKVDPEGELAVKTSNAFNEQWVVASKAGYDPPAGNWVMRKYKVVCTPASF